MSLFLPVRLFFFARQTVFWQSNRVFAHQTTRKNTCLNNRAVTTQTTPFNCAELTHSACETAPTRIAALASDCGLEAAPTSENCGAHFFFSNCLNVFNTQGFSCNALCCQKEGGSSQRPELSEKSLETTRTTDL